MNKKWIPVISPEHAGAYKELMDQVTSGLVQKVSGFIKNPSSLQYEGVGAMGGTAGDLLYLFYIAEYNEDESIYNLALEGLETLLAISTGNRMHGFCTGVPGLLWMLYHLENKEIVPDAGTMIDEELIDAFCTGCIELIKHADYDYMHGGLSMASPLLESKRRTAKHDHYLELMVDALISSATRGGEMAWWYYIIDFEKIDEKGISMGLSHGMPSIIAVLSKIWEQGIAQEKCKKLIEQVVNFVLDKKLKPGSSSLYPFSYRDDISEQPNGSGRIAWCYGDIDIAIALHYAYKVIPDERYKIEAEYLFKYIVDHNYENFQYTFDGSFCHGMCGNGHIFNRLYNMTGNENYREIADFWFKNIFPKVKMEDDVLKIHIMEKKITLWSDKTNIISGTAGIGLTLLSAMAEVRPDWDEMFLLNL